MGTVLPVTRLLSSFFPAHLILCSQATIAWAADLHVSHKVAERYRNATMLHEWDTVVKLAETSSLENVKAFETRHLGDAPTLDDEQTLLLLLGMAKIRTSVP